MRSTDYRTEGKESFPIKKKKKTEKNTWCSKINNQFNQISKIK